jgi:hypothetical protein
MEFEIVCMAMEEDHFLILNKAGRILYIDMEIIDYVGGGNGEISPCLD